MNVRSVLLTAVAVAVLSGCTTNLHLQREQTEVLSRGAPLAEIDRAVGKTRLLAEHGLDFAGKSYLARHYELQVGSKQEMVMLCTPTCVPSMQTIPITEDYVLIIAEPGQTLFAWGTLEELSRHPDESVSGMMPQVKEMRVAEIERARLERQRARAERSRQRLGL